MLIIIGSRNNIEISFGVHFQLKLIQSLSSNVNNIGLNENDYFISRASYQEGVRNKSEILQEKKKTF